MIEIAAQINPGYRNITVLSEEDQEKLRKYKVNQPVVIKVKGCRRPRSIQQNRWVHAIFKETARNVSDPEWDTPEKTKVRVKLAMKFFKDDIVVIDNRVYFNLRSFAFDEMDQAEADRVFNEARDICAAKLGVDPLELQAQAQQRPW